MISSPFFTRTYQFTLFLLVISPWPDTLHTLLCAASPAGVEAVLDPLGDLVQVAPALALHQQEAEKSLSSSIKSIKTPSGTVKCSCQTVSNDGDDPSSSLQDRDIFPNDPEKTIEIEIYKPAEDEDEEEAEATDRDEGESQIETSDKNNPLAVLRNSFTLDDNDASDTAAVDGNAASLTPFSQDRIFTTEEPTSFLSFLSSLVSSSAQAQALSQTQSVQTVRATEPEKIKSEAEQESEPVVYDDSSDDDTVSLNDDVNVANHRMFDTVTLTPPASQSSSVASTAKTIYKAFRSTDLIGARPVLLSSSDDSGSSSSEKMDNLRDDFFLWDFIYADHAAGAGKKRERLELGTVTDPFKGPRKRRRRRRALRGNGNNSPVVFVYPVGHQPTAGSSSYDKNYKNEVMTPENKTRPVMANQKTQRRDGPEVSPDKEEIRLAMQAAMDRAWQQYGPKGLDAPNIKPAPDQVYVIPESKVPSDLPYHGENAQPENKQHQQQVVRPFPQQSQQKQHLVYYTPPRPFLFIDRIFNPFQPMTSEWDKHVTSYKQGPPPPPPEPGPFSRFLASYIDFEVNNHEAADLMRKVVFGIFVGFLIAGWIALGAALGIVPFKKLLAFVAGTTYYDGAAAKRIDKGKGFVLRDTTLSEITDKILLSLDGDWLKRLEERVMANDAAGRVTGSGGVKVPSQVFCCILPEDENGDGMVECQVTKGGATSQNSKKKTSVFKCKTNLIYNFHFGPRDDDETEVEQDNIVNVKSKASNNANGSTTAAGEQEEK